MTPEVQLTVTNLNGDSDFLDLYENESISLTWRYSDLKSLEVKGAYTKQFRIPVSERNLALLGPLFDVNIAAGSASFSKKCNATLQVSTLPIEKGHIQIKKVITRLYPKLPDIEIVFYAETPDLAKAIGTKKLADIDYADLAHDVTFDNVVIGDPDNRWMYALTDKGFKFSQNGEAGTRPVLDTSAPVYPAEMTPCLNFLWLFEKILTDAGFTYEGDDLAVRLLEYWMPYVTGKYVKSPLLPGDFLFNVGLDTDVPSFTTTGAIGIPIPGLVEVFDNNGDFASDTWTAPNTATYNFKFWVTLDPFSFPDNEQVFITLRTPGGDLYWSSPTIWVNGTSVINYQSPSLQFFINEGAQMQLYIALSSGLTVTLVSSPTNDPATGTGWAMINNSTPMAGEAISWNLNAPDMAQIDFVKDVIKMHNLAMIPDRNIPNKLMFAPLADYIQDGVPKDWTDKLDRDKDVTIEHTTDAQSKKLKFTYKQGSDVISQLFKDRVYGDYVVEGYVPNSTDETNDFVQGETSVELSMSSTPANIIAGTSIVVPKFVDPTGEFVAPVARVLFLAGEASIALYNEATPGGEMATVNLINHYSVINATIGEEDLNFAPETPFHEIVANPYNNLFNRFYRTYLNEIYSPQARFMEAHFALELTDVLTFKFNDKIWIVDAYWRILEINDYVVGDNLSTRVKLIKVLDATLDCEGEPVSSSLGGIVNFEDANGDPIAATELCCIRYGLFWQADTSVCSSFPGGGINRPENEGYGGGFGGGVNGPNYSFILANNSEIPVSTVQSLLAGSFLRIADDNPYILGVGDSLRLDGSNPGTAMFGRNVFANMQGMHLGGGWVGSDRSTEGRMQDSTVILAADGSFPSSGGALELLRNGQAGSRINIPNRTAFACELRVIVGQWNAAGTSWTTVGHAIFTFDISKGGTAPGTASASAVNTVDADGFTALNLAIDVATDTDEHRFNLSDTGGSYPINNIKVSASLKITQLRQ